MIDYQKAVLARPENAALKEAHEEAEALVNELLVNFQRALTETEFERALVHADEVRARIVSAVYKKCHSAKRVQRLMLTAPPVEQYVVK